MTRERFERLYPLLAAHLLKRTITIEDRTYVGLVSDGKYVQIGSLHEEKQVEAYLQSHPTPADW